MAACCAARGVVVVEVAGVGCVGSTLRSVSFRLLVAMGSASYLIIPQNRLPDDFYTHQYVNDDTCVAATNQGVPPDKRCLILAERSGGWRSESVRWRRGSRRPPAR